MEQLTQEIASTLIGEMLDVATIDGNHDLGKIKVDDVKEACLDTKEFEGFSIDLSGSGPTLKDNTYLFKHKKLGAMPIFISAWAEGKYQAFFSYETV